MKFERCVFRFWGKNIAFSCSKMDFGGQKVPKKGSFQHYNGRFGHRNGISDCSCLPLDIHNCLIFNILTKHQTTIDSLYCNIAFQMHFFGREGGVKKRYKNNSKYLYINYLYYLIINIILFSSLPQIQKK